MYAPAKRLFLHRTFRIAVKYAFDTPTLSAIIAVNIHDIHESKRCLTKMENGEIVPLRVVTEDTSNLPLMVRSPVDFSKVKEIYEVYKGVNWTGPELCSILDRSEADTAKIERLPFLSKAAERMCKITGEIRSTYKIDTPEEMVATESKNSWSLERLKKEYESCTKCALGLKRKARNCNIVFGRGPEEPKIFIIGEAPGVQEEASGIAFHPDAPAGGVLKTVLSVCNINQDDCYITNGVLCRPEPDTGDKVQNGKPDQEHINICSSRLKMELLLTKARVIVLLGAYAYRAFYGTSIKGRIEEHLGWQENTSGDFKVYLTYHPSYIVRMISFEQDHGKVMDIKSSYKKSFLEIRKEIYGN